ncbi:MAG: Ribose-phosphate pyrophosphokinase [Myxococcota bacterium]|nr:Ribose-phosphate pyrophosphokinase [Myxococcota bacterium]
MTNAPMKIFAGNSNRQLAEEICAHVEKPLGDAKVGSFSDGETLVEIRENVRGHDVYIIQSTCQPANHHLMELLVMVDAVRRASAASICTVIPYFGYARQDRKVAPRTPISAKLVAELLQAAGATRAISMDLHTGQLQGFFEVPFDHLYSLPIALEYMKERYDPATTVVVSPDAGGVERARAYSKRLGASLAIIDKRRTGVNEAQVMNIIGDVAGMDAIIVDDIIDTAGTLCNAAQAVMDHGARKVSAYATHPVFSGPAISRIAESVLDEVIVTNTIPLSAEARKPRKIKQLSVAKVLGEAIRRIHDAESVSELFI